MVLVVEHACSKAEMQCPQTQKLRNHMSAPAVFPMGMTPNFPARGSLPPLRRERWSTHSLKEVWGVCLVALFAGWCCNQKFLELSPTVLSGSANSSGIGRWCRSRSYDAKERCLNRHCAFRLVRCCKESLFRSLRFEPLQSQPQKLGEREPVWTCAHPTDLML